MEAQVSSGSAGHVLASHRAATGDRPLMRQGDVGTPPAAALSGSTMLSCLGAGLHALICGNVYCGARTAVRVLKVSERMTSSAAL